MTSFGPHQEPDLSKAKLPRLPVVYHSKSEAGVAAVLQKFIPDWRPIMDDTVQVQLGGGRTVDFRVGKILLEYHPITLVREMRSEKAKKLLDSLYNVMSHGQTCDVREMLKQELIEQYRHRRWQLVTCSKYAGHGLIVVQSIEELHQRALPKMLRRVPPLTEVKAVFFEGCRQ